MTNNKSAHLHPIKLRTYYNIILYKGYMRTPLTKNLQAVCTKENTVPNDQTKAPDLMGKKIRQGRDEPTTGVQGREKEKKHW